MRGILDMLQFHHKLSSADHFKLLWKDVYNVAEIMYDSAVLMLFSQCDSFLSQE